MTDQDDVVKCPFCGGHGELRRAEIVQRLKDPAVARTLQANPTETGNPGGDGSKPRDFFRDVHSWNPKLPIWRRSSKE
jgi:hypothetical protein